MKARIAVGVKLSGHYCWLMMVPIINACVFLTLAFLWGDNGDNRFGADPKVDDHPLLIWNQ